MQHETRERLAEISRELDRHSKEPESDICWVSGSGNEAEDLCVTCARMKVKALNRRARREWRHAGRKEGFDKPYSVGGACGYRDSEGSAVCNCCGAHLTYSLTGYGLSEELDHFSDVADGWDAPPSPEIVYQVERVISAAAYRDDDDDVALALAIGEATLAALQHQGGPSHAAA